MKIRLIPKMWPRWFRIWRCRKEFSKLSPFVRETIKYMKLDPDSLIKRGDFDN